MIESLKNKYGRYVVVFIIIALVGSVFFWIASRGRIVIDSNTSWTATIKPLEGPSRSYGIGRPLKSGTYLLNLSSSAGNYTAEVKVPRFMNSVKVKPFIGKQLSGIKLANNTDELSVLSENTVYTMKLGDSGPKSSFTKHRPTNRFPYNSEEPINTVAHFEALASTRSLFLGTTYNREGDGNVLAVLNPKTNKLFVLKNSPIIPYGDLNKIGFFSNQTEDSFVVSTTSDTRYYSGDLTTSKRLDLAPGAKLYETGLADYRNGTLVAYSGKVFDPSLEEYGEGEKDSSAEYSVTYINPSTNTVKSFKKSSSYSVSRIVLSPENNLVALSTSDKKVVILDGDGKQVGGVNFEDTDLDTQWLNSTTLSYLDPTLGLRALNIENNSAYSLFQSPLLSYSAYQVLSNDKIKLSAYPKTPGKNIDPGRMVFLVSSDSNKEARVISDNIPSTKSTYHLDTFNGVIYFYPLAKGPNDPLYEDKQKKEQEIARRKQEAKKYLESIGITKTKLYVDTDLRTVEEFISF